MPRAILFDLDGTLVDTRGASWPLFQETNRAFELGVATREQFFRAFEGNFFDSLARLCPEPQKFAAAKAHFMELLRTRYHPAFIPGMVDVIHALAPHCSLAVISTNGIEAIRRILVDAGVATCFSHVFAGDVEPSKAASMRRFLADRRYAARRLCTPAYREGDAGPALEADDVVLVTDTVGDVREAREAGIRAVGVSWGMHGERELLHAGAERVALWPQELIAWLREAAGAAACACSTAETDPACACTAADAGSPAPALQGPDAAPADALAAAATQRRARQLHARQAHAGGRPPAASRASPFNAGSRTGDELLAALQRIVAGERRLAH